jgi:AcrR family transcriptional regulator
MGRYKTISDDEILCAAREVFRQQGHTATTREIGQAAGISEAVLYQRFGSKDDLFFAAMAPKIPDIEALLGPENPPDDAHEYLHAVVVRIGGYFREVLPLILHLMTHPSFDLAMLPRAKSADSNVCLRESLAERLASLLQRRRIATSSPEVTARLLVSIAHDWALGMVLSPENCVQGDQELKKMVDVVWQGLRGRRA